MLIVNVIILQIQRHETNIAARKLRKKYKEIQIINNLEKIEKNDKSDL